MYKYSNTIDCKKSDTVIKIALIFCTQPVKFQFSHNMDYSELLILE